MFLGNKKLKRPNQEIEYTPEMVKELISCINSFDEFTKFVKILNPDKGITQFEPFFYQKEMAHSIFNNRFCVFLTGRQMGKTTIMSVISCYLTFFQDNFKLGITSDKFSSAKDFINRIKLVYQELPDHLKPGIKSWNAASIEFDNGSVIEACATTPNSFVGRSLNVLICDEFAKVRPGAAQDFWNSVYPTISSGKQTKIIIISTPKGMHNLFHTIYTEAEKGRNEFASKKYTWRDRPDRTEKWAEQEIKNLGGMENFRQEHEAEFVGSGDTIINVSAMNDLIDSYKSPLESKKELKIYQRKNPLASYVIGVDVGKGIGKDYSVAQVFKIVSLEPIKLEQTAVYASNKINPKEFAPYLHKLGLEYNNAYMMVECNSMGEGVVSDLWFKHQYENMYNYGKKRNQLGIYSSRKTKSDAVLFMKKLVENGNVELYDKDTINELLDYSFIGNKFTGVNLHDDRVSAMYWAMYLFQTDLIDYISFNEINREEEDQPFGFLVDDSHGTWNTNEEEDMSWVVTGY